MLALSRAFVGCNPTVTDVEPLFSPVTGGMEVVFSAEGLNPWICAPGNVLFTSRVLNVSLNVYVSPNLSFPLTESCKSQANGCQKQ